METQSSPLEMAVLVMRTSWAFSTWMPSVLGAQRRGANGQAADEHAAEAVQLDWAVLHLEALHLHRHVVGHEKPQRLIMDMTVDRSTSARRIFFNRFQGFFQGFFCPHHYLLCT
jgi:hypothetical protein